MTSHSPAVLSRVNPVEVRYCRCDPESRVSSVKKIKLPSGLGEDAKFVRGAMLAYAARSDHLICVGRLEDALALFNAADQHLADAVVESLTRKELSGIRGL